MTTQFTATSFTRPRQSMHQPRKVPRGKHLIDLGLHCQSVRLVPSSVPLRSSRAIIRKAVEADTVLSEAMAESESQIGTCVRVYGSNGALEVLLAHLAFKCPSSRRSACPYV